MNSMEFAKLARCASVLSAGLLALSATVNAQPTQHYTQTNLVSDMPGMAAATDPNLVNAWGMSRGSTSPWWVSDNGTGLATLYSGTGSAVSLVVTIPGNASGVTGTPSGQVFNGTTDFNLVTGQPAKFIFVTEDGTVSGWNPNVKKTAAVLKWSSKGASVFKGIAMATVGNPQGTSTNYLYIADFRRNRILVLDTNFHPVTFGDNDDDDNFVDESLPAGFAPFNIQNIGGQLYVAFAMQDSQKHDEIDGPGLGYVDVFSTTGHWLRRLQHNNYMNGPWGMTQAPSDFGVFSHDILVGQFGSGNIMAFDPVTGGFRGRLAGTNNKAIAIDGLWGIGFGNDSAAGPATTLYFTAGPQQESHGLFGTLTAVENNLGGDQ
jgi:uncharacterized protein (TIGR03118 family)